jgi:hypothetical protein
MFDSEDLDGHHIGVHISPHLTPFSSFSPFILRFTLLAYLLILTMQIATDTVDALCFGSLKLQGLWTFQGQR